MQTSLKTDFAQIFSCCPKKLSCPKFGGAAAPLAPLARTPMFVYTFFVSVTQSGLVRISKMMHRWKDLSLLKLLLTNLFTSSESQMGPGRTVCICIVPYGSYTTVAALKGLSSVQTYGPNNSKHWWEFLANNVVAVCTELRVKR